MGFLPVRENDRVATYDNIDYLEFKDPPRRLVPFEEMFFVLHNKKLVCFLKEEHLEIGSMNDFDKMN